MGPGHSIAAPHGPQSHPEGSAGRGRFGQHRAPSRHDVRGANAGHHVAYACMEYDGFRGTLVSVSAEMPQCVQTVTQQAIACEALQAARNPARIIDAPDYRREVMQKGVSLSRWPLYLVRRACEKRRAPADPTIALSSNAPPEWRGIVGSRLIPMAAGPPLCGPAQALLPQLEACGFLSRPLCVDAPAYVILLWPADAQRATSPAARRSAGLPPEHSGAGRPHPSGPRPPHALPILHAPQCL